MADAPTTRAALLATVARLAQAVAPLATSPDPEAVRLRLLQVLRAATELAQLLSRFDLGEDLDRAAETATGQLAEYCKQFAQGPQRALPPLLEICTHLTAVLCRVHEAVLATVDS